MTLIYMDPLKAIEVPIQTVKLNGVADPTIICSVVQSGAQSTTAQFRAPYAVFDTDKLRYYTAEAEVYADAYRGEGGAPIFRGVIEGGNSRLRGEEVLLPGRSLLSYLRSRSTCVRSSLRSDDGGTRTFAGPFKESFLEHDPYVHFTRAYKEYQPWDILYWYVQNRLDPWFANRITFYFDSALQKLQTRRIQLARWVVDEEVGEPILTIEELQKSPIGDQIFRLVTWGQLIDFVAELIPGVQVFERFNNSGAEVWFMQPWRGGRVLAATGRTGFDWRAAGADIHELENEVSNVDAINRVCVIGLPASCTISLMSEMKGTETFEQEGLIPDWPIYDLEADDLEEFEPLIGFSFNYTTGEYSDPTVIPQQITKILRANNPEIGIPGNPDFVPGLEWVGRRWRLPNWFTFASLERGGDMFVDPRTGDQVNFQFFVETIKQTPAGDFYDWQRYPYVVDVDWKTKRITFPECPLTSYLKLETEGEFTGLYKVDHSRGPKLCRIGFTFTYSIDNFVPYADTFIQQGGVIDTAQLTAIGPGQPLTFQRVDLGFSQLTNIGMPLFRKYSETVPVSREQADVSNRVFQNELPEQTEVEYNQLIVHAETETAELVRTFIDITDTPHTLATDGPLEEPYIFRDDTAQLHSVAFETLANYGRRPRRFKLQLGSFSKAPMRGMFTQILNLQAGGGAGMDMIDSVTHNLETGQTGFTTNNQISNTDSFSESRDTEIGYA